MGALSVAPAEPAPAAPRVARGALDAREPRWSDVLLVCNACKKRGSGPKKLRPKALASLLKAESRRAGLRTRVVMTGCLGLCPKAATTVVRVGGRTSARMVAVASKKQVDAALAALRPLDGDADR